MLEPGTTVSFSLPSENKKIPKAKCPEDCTLIYFILFPSSHGKEWVLSERLSGTGGIL